MKRKGVGRESDWRKAISSEEPGMPMVVARGSRGVILMMSQLSLLMVSMGRDSRAAKKPRALRCSGAAGMEKGLMGVRSREVGSAAKRGISGEPMTPKCLAGV